MGSEQGWESRRALGALGEQCTGYEGELGVRRAGDYKLGKLVQLVRVGWGWENRGCPLVFRGAGTACEGEQRANRTGGAPGFWGEQVQVGEGEPEAGRAGGT